MGVVPPGLLTRMRSSSLHDELLTPIRYPSAAVGSELSTPCGVNGYVPNPELGKSRDVDRAGAENRALLDDEDVRAFVRLFRPAELVDADVNPVCVDARYRVVRETARVRPDSGLEEEEMPDRRRSDRGRVADGEEDPVVRERDVDHHEEPALGEPVVPDVRVARVAGADGREKVVRRRVQDAVGKAGRLAVSDDVAVLEDDELRRPDGAHRVRGRGAGRRGGRRISGHADRLRRERPAPARDFRRLEPLRRPLTAERRVRVDLSPGRVLTSNEEVERRLGRHHGHPQVPGHDLAGRLRDTAADRNRQPGDRHPGRTFGRGGHTGNRESHGTERQQHQASADRDNPAVSCRARWSLIDQTGLGANRYPPNATPPRKGGPRLDETESYQEGLEDKLERA